MLEKERAAFLAKKFPEQPFTKEHVVPAMKLISLSKEMAIVSTFAHEGMWTDFGIANGMTLGPVANAAGVFLAMMHSDFFTPLTEGDKFVWLRPTIKGTDNEIIATAKVLGTRIKGFKGVLRPVIAISVEVSALGGKVKMRGILEYVLLEKEYKVKPH